MKKIMLLFLVSVLSCFLLSSASADDQKILFSKQYDSTKDRSNIYIDSFNAMPGEAILSVENGDGQYRITKVHRAEIWFNGINLFDRVHFYKKDQVEATVNLAETNTLEVSLRGTVGSFLTIKVKEKVTPPPFVSLSADPVLVIAGNSSTLIWSSTNANTVSITPDIGTVSVSGTITVSPSATTVYTITAEGLGGTAQTRSRSRCLHPPPQSYCLGSQENFW